MADSVARDLPRVAGVTGGVGTTTVAAAMGGRDMGIYRRGDPVDVIVARPTMWSLGCAQRALATAPGPAPLLAVVADQARVGLPRTAQHRLRMTEGLVSGVVLLPFVEMWRGDDHPHRSAAGALTGRLLAQADTRGTRAFVAAAGQLAAHLEARLAGSQTNGHVRTPAPLSAAPARVTVTGPENRGQPGPRLAAVAAGTALVPVGGRARPAPGRADPVAVVRAPATSPPGRHAPGRR